MHNMVQRNKKPSLGDVGATDNHGHRVAHDRFGQSQTDRVLLAHGAKPKGYVRIGNVLEVPIYLHWTFPVGAIMPAAIFGLGWSSVFYFSLAYALLVVIHETGHLLVAKATGHAVSAIEISGFGGRCYVAKRHSALSAFLIALGGLLAQLVALAAAVAYVAVAGAHAHEAWANCFLITFTFWNVLLVIANLVPIRRKQLGEMTDGAKLWLLLRYFWLNRQSRIR